MTKRINFIDDSEYSIIEPPRPAGEVAHNNYASKKIFVNRDRWQTYSRPLKRDILNHELFHNKVPVLGRSETLAIIYGKLKARRGLKAILSVLRKRYASKI